MLPTPLHAACRIQKCGQPRARQPLVIAAVDIGNFPGCHRGSITRTVAGTLSRGYVAATGFQSAESRMLPW